MSLYSALLTWFHSFCSDWARVLLFFAISSLLLPNTIFSDQRGNPAWNSTHDLIITKTRFIALNTNTCCRSHGWFDIIILHVLSRGTTFTWVFLSLRILMNLIELLNDNYQDSATCCVDHCMCNHWSVPLTFRWRVSVFSLSLKFFALPSRFIWVLFHFLATKGMTTNWFLKCYVPSDFRLISLCQQSTCNVLLFPTLSIRI